MQVHKRLTLAATAITIAGGLAVAVPAQADPLAAAASQGAKATENVLRFPGNYRWLPEHFSGPCITAHGGFPVYRGIDGTRLDRVAHSLRLKLRLVGLMHSAGVPLRLGTDSQPFTIPGQALHTEMRLFSQAGIPAPEVWRMATSGAGRTLGPGLGEPALGTLAPGAPADLLLYDADPTSRTDPSDGLKAVVTRGRLYTRAALDTALDADRRRLRRPLPALLGRIGSGQVLRTTDFSF